MASPAANAAKYDLAHRKMNDAMKRLSASTGVPVPPPLAKFASADERYAREAERMAQFLSAIADATTKENNHA